jgi:hypothetical protein
MNKIILNFALFGLFSCSLHGMANTTPQPTTWATVRPFLPAFGIGFGALSLLHSYSVYKKDKKLIKKEQKALKEQQKKIHNHVDGLYKIRTALGNYFQQSKEIDFGDKSKKEAVYQLSEGISQLDCDAIEKRELYFGVRDIIKNDNKNIAQALAYNGPLARDVAQNEAVKFYHCVQKVAMKKLPEIEQGKTQKSNYKKWACAGALMFGRGLYVLLGKR